MADARTTSLKNSVFAKSATTTIPSSPAAGTPYRDLTYVGEEVANGWPFKNVVDSSQFNNIMFNITGLLNDLEKQGILYWSELTDYVVGSICRDNIDGNLYEAIAASGPSGVVGAKQPSTETSYWKLASFSDNMKRDASNAIPLVISSGTVTGFDYIIAMGTNTDGTNLYWFRKWASGWFEQGGFMARVPDGSGTVEGYHTVTFPLPFLNTEYYVYMGVYGGENGRSVYRNFRNDASPSNIGVDMCVRGDSHPYKYSMNWLAIGRWK